MEVLPSKLEDYYALWNALPLDEVPTFDVVPWPDPPQKTDEIGSDWTQFAVPSRLNYTIGDVEHVRAYRIDHLLLSTLHPDLHTLVDLLTDSKQSWADNVRAAGRNFGGMAAAIMADAHAIIPSLSVRSTLITGIMAPSYVCKTESAFTSIKTCIDLLVGIFMAYYAESAGRAAGKISNEEMRWHPEEFNEVAERLDKEAMAFAELLLRVAPSNADELSRILDAVPGGDAAIHEAAPQTVLDVTERTLAVMAFHTLRVLRTLESILSRLVKMPTSLHAACLTPCAIARSGEMDDSRREIASGYFSLMDLCVGHRPGCAGQDDLTAEFTPDISSLSITEQRKEAKKRLIKQYYADVREKQARAIECVKAWHDRAHQLGIFPNSVDEFNNSIGAHVAKLAKEDAAFASLSTRFLDANARANVDRYVREAIRDPASVDKTDTQMYTSICARIWARDLRELAVNVAYERAIVLQDADVPETESPVPQVSLFAIELLGFAKPCVCMINPPVAVKVAKVDTLRPDDAAEL